MEQEIINIICIVVIIGTGPSRLIIAVLMLTYSLSILLACFRTTLLVMLLPGPSHRS